MKYIWKNIYSFFKTETSLFCLCILCILLSSQLMLVAYGIYGCYTKKKLSRESDMNSMEIGLSENDVVTKGELSGAFLKCPSELTDGIDTIIVYTDYTADPTVRPLDLRFAVRDGKISSSVVFGENIKISGLADKYFTEKQEIDGEKVAMIYNGNDQEIQAWADSIKKEDGTLEILGNTYNIIGEQSWGAVLIPYQSLDDQVPLTSAGGITLFFHDPVTREQYNILKERLTQELGYRVLFPERKIYDFNQLYLYNTILLINGFILITAAVNFTMIYRYILMKRKRNLAIFRVCGLTRARAAVTYLGECIFLMILILPVSFVGFRFLLLPVLADTYTNIWDLFPLNIYGKFGIAYLTIFLIVLLPVVIFELSSRTLKERI